MADLESRLAGSRYIFFLTHVRVVSGFGRIAGPGLVRSRMVWVWVLATTGASATVTVADVVPVTTCHYVLRGPVLAVDLI